jgi:hypothetical protein
MTHGADIDGGSTAGLDGLRYMGPPEKGKSTAAQLVSAIETR